MTVGKQSRRTFVDRQVEAGDYNRTINKTCNPEDPSVYHQDYKQQYMSSMWLQGKDSSYYAYCATAQSSPVTDTNFGDAPFLNSKICKK